MRKLAVLHGLVLFNKVFLVGHLAVEVIPAGHLCELRLKGFHHQCTFLCRADVGTVAATGAVEYAHLDAEFMAFKTFSVRFHGNRSFGKLLHFLLIDEERPDGGMRAYK